MALDGHNIYIRNYIQSLLLSTGENKRGLHNTMLTPHTIIGRKINSFFDYTIEKGVW